MNHSNILKLLTHKNSIFGMEMKILCLLMALWWWLGGVTALLPAQSLPKLSQHSDGSLILGPDGRQLQWLRGY